MSIISLELPRNSIVLIDDNFIRPTRNNSSASLTSLVPLASPNDPAKDNYISHRLTRIRAKNSSAIVSDDDSESEHVPSRFRWRRRSSEKVQKPAFLSSLKKDFKFKYDRIVLPKLSLAPPATHPDDITASPLSLASDLALAAHIHHIHNHHVGPMAHAHQHQLHHALDSDLDALPPPRSLGAKKLRTSPITQSIFLKKRLLLSKDIQLELLGGHNTHTHATSASIPADNTRFPASLPVLPVPQAGLIHTYLLVHNADILAPLAVRKSPSPPRETSEIRLQNKLITELNRKWNKTSLDDGRRMENVVPTISKKRVRSELVSSSDSYSASH